jgi:Svf1-like N-terminal lipocalin domain
VENYSVDDDKYSFFADGCAVELSEDGRTFTIKSATNEASLVNLKITQVAPGFKAGKDGTSYFGTDMKNPWGSMRHVFWPRCKAEGTITTKDGAIDFTGRALFIHALQGMKPHHAGALLHPILHPKSR